VRYGFAILESVHPVTDVVLRALDARPTVPHVFPLWSNWDAGEWPLDRKLLSGIRERGVEPVVLAESTGVPYEDILAGRADTALKLLALRAEGLVVRWDQEPNSKGLGADWYDHPLYVPVFQHVSHVMRKEADVRLAYCPSVNDRMAESYPGHEACQVVATDIFSRQEAGRFPPEQWKRPLAELARMAPGKPRWVMESGRLVGLTRRAEWLRSFELVEDVEVAIAWDMSVPNSADDFTWTKAMGRAFAAMMEV